MFTIYKPLEPTIWNTSEEQSNVKLNESEEYELYNQYINTPVKYRHKFINKHLDKLEYISKYLDINYLLPLYLNYDFLENHLTQTVIDNLIHSNVTNLIDISSFVSSNFNFNMGLAKSILNKNTARTNKFFNNSFHHLKNDSNQILSNNKNKEFRLIKGKLMCSLLNYQKLNTAQYYSDLTTFSKEYNNKIKCCYICHKIFSLNCTFSKYVSMCYDCGCFNYKMRLSKAPMDSIRAYVSGCRHTVGYYTVLNILRNGGTVLGSTRFPRCAQLNFMSEPDYQDFKDRLEIVQCDFTNLNSVNELIEKLKNFKPNTFISNAFQTVRQSPTYYQKANLLENELSNFDDQIDNNQLKNFMNENKIVINQHKNLNEDRTFKTQWTQDLIQMDTSEIIECNVINQVIPTILFQKILDIMIKLNDNKTNFYLVNVSSTESHHTDSNHIVTSMNKIAMDNLINRVRLSLPENFIAFNADPGFVTGVRNDNDKPLDGQDGAIRILKPIMDAINGNNYVNDKTGSIFYKDYKMKSY